MNWTFAPLSIIKFLFLETKIKFLFLDKKNNNAKWTHSTLIKGRIALQDERRHMRIFAKLISETMKGTRMGFYFLSQIKLFGEKRNEWNLNLRLIDSIWSVSIVAYSISL